MQLSLKAGAFALALMIFQLLTSYIVYFFSIDSLLIQSCVIYFAALGIPTVIYIAVTKSKAQNALFLNPLNLFNIILIILMSLCIQPLLYFLSGISTLLFPNVVAEQMNTYADTNVIVLLLSLAVLPAFFEEICYRGIIFSGYGNVNIKKAAVICGFLFAIAHLSAQQFLYSFFVGIVFCIMVYYTKSIYSSMLSHFLINSIQVIIIKLSVQIPAVDTAAAVSISDIGTMGIAAAATLPLLALLFIAFIKINAIPSDMLLLKNENILQHNPDKAYEEKAVTWPIILLTVYYVLMTIIAPNI